MQCVNINNVHSYFVLVIWFLERRKFMWIVSLRYVSTWILTFFSKKILFIHLWIDFKCTWTNLNSRLNTEQKSVSLFNLCNNLYSYCGNITAQSVYVAHRQAFYNTLTLTATLLTNSKFKQLNEHLFERYFDVCSVILL